MPKHDHNDTKQSIPSVDLLLKETVWDPHKRGKDKKSFGLKQLFRRKKHPHVPSINIKKVHASLITDLSALASQLVATVRLEDHAKWIEQLTESVHVIRRHVASGAACIQPFLITPRDTSVSVNYRPAMGKLSAFHDAYVEFIDWVHLVSALVTTTQETQDNNAAVSNFIDEKTISQGQALFNALHFSALAVFDFLKVCGFASLTDPTEWEAISRGHLPKAPEAIHPEGSAPSLKADDNHSSGVVLTDGDRALLAKLWSQVDALSESGDTPGPPQKPPHPHGASTTNHIESTSAHSSRIALPRCPSNTSQDTAMSAYFMSLAEAILPPIQNAPLPEPPADESASNSDTDTSPPPPPPLPVRYKSGDFSFAEGTKQERCTSELTTNGIRPSGGKVPNPSRWSSELPGTHIHKHRGLRKNKSLRSTCNSTASPTHSQASTGTPLSSSSSQASVRTAPQAPSHTDNGTFLSPAHLSNPLDDHHMQENIAVVAMRLSNVNSTTDKPEMLNPFLTEASLAFRHHPHLISTNGGDLPQRSWTDLGSLPPVADADALFPGGQPVCYSEIKTNIEDDSELIEANGKKYRRYFQRHVVIERHRLKQLVVAPSLPDGTGPDLRRAVCPSDVSNLDVAPASPISTNSPSATEQQDLVDRVAEVKPHKVKPVEDKRDSIEFSYDSDDHQSDSEQQLSPLKPPVPKVPYRVHSRRPLTEYMYQFGSSESDPDVERRLSVNLTNFFRSSWNVEELAEGPHQRSKVMSYVETYAQPTPDGDVHRSTSVQHTCSVRLVGGLQALKESISSVDALDESGDTDQNSVQTKEKEDSTEGSYSEHVHEPTEIPEPPITPRQPSTVVDTTPIEFPICSEILGLIKADEYLVWSDSESPNEVSVHAGCIDALIVYLTSFGSMSPSYYLFTEAFLFTYRAFVSPADLIKRLIVRYKLFRDDAAQNLSHRQANAKVRSATGSILVSVVSRLREDLTPEVQHLLKKFKKSLIRDKARSLAKYLDVNIRNQLAWQKQQEQEAQELARAAELEAQNQQLDEEPESSVMSDVVTGTVPSDSEDFVPLTPPTPPARNASVKPLPPEPPSRAIFGSFISSRSDVETNKTDTSTGHCPFYLAYTFLSFSAQDIAEQMTYLESKKYSRIRISEVLNIRNLERGKAPSVSACAQHFSSVSNWATHQILGSPPGERDKVANRLLDVMEHLHTLQNFSSYLSILCAFMLVPENVFSKKTLARLNLVRPYMQPPHFAKYRRELENATPPLIPYLGLMMQNLIVLAQGNVLFYSSPPASLENTHRAEHGPIVNFWRCWKHFLIIHFIVKQENMDPEKAHYNITPNQKVLEFLNDFQDCPSETDLRDLANKLRRGET